MNDIHYVLGGEQLFKPENIYTIHAFCFKDITDMFAFTGHEKVILKSDGDIATKSLHDAVNKLKRIIIFFRNGFAVAHDKLREIVNKLSEITVDFYYLSQPFPFPFPGPNGPY